jgi:glycosyltransferase involved in cell wall biosynthesis
MNMEPSLVSIVTPVHNGAKYLAECIESVLAQTYRNLEYIIVNNCSADRTLEIAEKYARKEERIRVYNNDELLDIIANHNRAFRLISPNSKYCKVVSADDWIFPQCVERMVEVAEANPSVGIVGSYQLCGEGAKWGIRSAEVPYPSTVVSGREICRSYLLTKTYVFGSPTSSLYRSDLIRGGDSFYPNSTAEADASACIKHLRYADFGFVHQILSYERIHESQITSTSRSLNAYISSRISDLLEYGPVYLKKDELERRLKEQIDEYYEYLAVCAVNFRGKTFWSFHKRRLSELGHPFSIVRLAKCVGIKLLDLLFNPKQSIEKVLKRLNTVF